MVKKKNSLRILNVLMLLSFVGIIISGAVLVAENTAYTQGDTSYEAIRKLSPRATNIINDQMELTPGSTIPEFDLAKLKVLNPDTVGWIWAEGTRIDYPIVQGKDNDYYLKHMFDGELNKVGAIFMDWRNGPDFSDKNTIIYGHHMKDGSMFAALADFKDQAAYEKKSEMILFTQDGNYRIELFAGNIVHGETGRIPLSFDTDQEFKSYLADVLKKSTFKSDVTILETDRIITLATCTYEFNNARYLLFGKLVAVVPSCYCRGSLS